ncbi:Wzz/FepE/Etk N-terminal domain-containing protein [Psychrobium sp. 1_MG-2023]|uniref:Wzz/FepE/Etk N-terminal domain-containing protein n=1 Tax=Psychrobium sp. 1_MG-2023 TaxID=3062624 RepID=UPI000C33C13C|nr:Wzz/FepE/Etk N-terminal domain-containing protein [Psychrobium sp. 1_MG-2023]MDP2562080.1 Wzz/FepE/Etk N-terminal domain-containing protein [Psychrobium sp. 1_MG-2023]PKF55680.1 LPS O-antigen length regulator [Alteromonadales bacterium alter-6D02]
MSDQRNTDPKKQYDSPHQLDKLVSVNSQYELACNDEVDLKELWKAFWSGKWVIALITSVFILVSVIYSLSLPNYYRTEILLAPSSDESSGGAGVASQLGGLASLAGLNVSSGGIDKTSLSIEIIKSKKFIGNFIKKYELLAPLMAIEKWDHINNQLLYDESLYNSKTSEWLTSESGETLEPTKQQAYWKFIELLDINDDIGNSLIIISMTHQSPHVAKQWLDWLIKDINEQMKQRELFEAEKSIKYLTKQLEVTKVKELRAALYRIIEEQTKTIMFAQVRHEYIFKTIDPAIIPEVKSGPKRALICILGAFLGVLVATIVVFVRYFSKNKE